MRITKVDSPRRGANPATLNIRISAALGKPHDRAHLPTGKKSGKELERAVRLVQESILGAEPNLIGHAFSIETNKILQISGVRHEVDVFVTMLPDSPYQSTWIFECKDWKKPVGKNELIVLSEKVAALGANKGFLVARSMTKDAVAQMALDPRLTFVPATQDFVSPINIELFHVSYDVLPIQIGIKQRDAAPKAIPDTLDWQECRCRFQNKATGLVEFFRPFIDDLVLTKDPETEPKHSQVGSHFDRRAQRIVFECGELIINDMEVENLVMDVSFFIDVEKQKIISRFQLKDQGCHYSFAPLDDIIPGKRIEVDIVQRS